MYQKSRIVLQARLSLFHGTDYGMERVWLVRTCVHELEKPKVCLTNVVHLLLPQHELGTAEEVKKWIPSINREIEYCLQVGCYRNQYTPISSIPWLLCKPYCLFSTMQSHSQSSFHTHCYCMSSAINTACSNSCGMRTGNEASHGMRTGNETIVMSVQWLWHSNQYGYYWATSL